MRSNWPPPNRPRAQWIAVFIIIFFPFFFFFLVRIHDFRAVFNQTEKRNNNSRFAIIIEILRARVVNVNRLAAAAVDGDVSGVRFRAGRRKFTRAVEKDSLRSYFVPFCSYILRPSTGSRTVSLTEHKKRWRKLSYDSVFRVCRHKPPVPAARESPAMGELFVHRENSLVKSAIVRIVPETTRVHSISYAQV